MPELPDVEVYRGYLARTVLHKKITDVEINDKQILDASPKEIKKLKGRKFEDVSRQGKYCFLRISDGRFLVLHFGMTGDVEYYKDKKDPDKGQVIFTFSDGHKFAFINVRKLGKVYLKNSKEDFVEKKGIGPDSSSLSKKEFSEIMDSKRGSIKGALMDQKSLSGIGNIYGDEILYQAGIRPDRKMKDIGEKEISEIHKQTMAVFKAAIKAKARPEGMPKDYLLRGRREEGAKCGKDNGRIKRIKINGRSSYYCPKHQK